MRNLILQEFLTVDGMAAGPDGNTDFIAAATRGDQSYLRRQKVFFDSIDTILLGRKTYEIMAAYWPNAPSDDPYAHHLNSVQKYVASKTLDGAEWQNTTILRDVAAEVAKLKEGPGKNISVLGSGNLVKTLMRHDLVDEFSFFVYPIILGGGKRLFPDDDQVRKLRLVDSKPTTTGGLLLTYEPAR